MNKKNLQKPITLTDLGNFTEEVLLPGVEKILDEKLEKFVTNTNLEEAFKNFENGLATRFADKDYLDQKFFASEEKIISRVIKEKRNLKDTLILLINIIRKNRKPTKKEKETLVFLEQELLTT